ncbi:MAG: FN3 associated domain-containing protein [Verrucomicrobiota bacterium]
MHQARLCAWLVTWLALGTSLGQQAPTVPAPSGATPASGASLVTSSRGPRFKPERGFHETGFELEITAAEPKAVIRYTTDGSVPSADNGSVYQHPITISQTTVVRAVAEGPGPKAGKVGTHTYLFVGDIIRSRRLAPNGKRLGISEEAMKSALLSLPSVSLVSDAPLTKARPAAASVEWVDPNGLTGQESCGVHYYGGEFTQFAKKNFRLHFGREYGGVKWKVPIFAGHEHGLAAVEEFDQLELRGGSHDMVERGFYMSNLFADDSLLEMGHLNPHGRFVHVYLNGSYWGVYHLRERWNAGMHRRYLGGAATNYESINGNWNVGGWAPGKAYDGDGRTWRKVLADRANYGRVRHWVDVGEYVDFMLLWMFGRCEDEYRCVGPTVPGSGFKFYLNDADGFFAGPWYGEPSRRTEFSRRGGRLPGDGPAGLFSALFVQGDPEYRTLLADRIYRRCFNQGALTPERTTDRLKTRCDELELAFAAEAARWMYRPPNGWLAVRNSILGHWLPARTAQLVKELRDAGFYPALDAPTLNQQGGRVEPGFQVAFSASQGTIYYTLDGTDPRLPGGAIAPSAQAAPIHSAGRDTAASLPPIRQNTVVKSRVRAGQEWSALNEAFFQAEATAFAPEQILIQQRLFQTPPGVPKEYIEIQNTSGRAANLAGARLTGGIHFTFAETADAVLAPGQKLILVKDLFAFRRDVSLDVPVAGIYIGTLEETATLGRGGGGSVPRGKAGKSLF